MATFLSYYSGKSGLGSIHRFYDFYDYSKFIICSKSGHVCPDVQVSHQVIITKTDPVTHSATSSSSLDQIELGKLATINIQLIGCRQKVVSTSYL